MKADPRRLRTAVLPPVAALLMAACGGGDGGGEDAAALPANAALYFPDRLADTAPETFRARFETTEGAFVIEVHRAQAPRGADRFYNLVKNGYFDGVRFFRVIEGFVAQFGMHGEPQVQVRWSAATIPDDPVAASNMRGTVTFAKGGPNTRTTQLFINLVDNTTLDGDGFAPIGGVVEGMDVVDRIHSGYGELAGRGGNGPVAQNIAARGNEYLAESFPEMDYVVSAALVDPAGEMDGDGAAAAGDGQP